VATAMLGEISSRRCYEMKRVPLGVIFSSRPAALSCRRPSDQEPQYHLARYYPSFYLRIGEGDGLLCCLIDRAVALRNLGGNTASYKIPRETSYASFYPPNPSLFPHEPQNFICTTFKGTKTTDEIRNRVK